MDLRCISCLQEHAAGHIPSRRKAGQLWHFLGNDGSTEDSVLASALGADPAGVRACTALLWPGSNVPTVPSTACGPSGDRWQ